jgi:hypothetical protein
MTELKGPRAPSRGATLTELMVAVAVLSVGVLGMFGTFRYISRSVFVSRAQSLATNLAQERVESLKNLSYYSLLITTAPATDATVTPAIVYDTLNYPPETINIGGIRFTRYTYVSMAELDDGEISEVLSTYPDTGLKQITVNIVWTDMGSKKRWTLTNLLENPNVNPLDATITGTVSNAAGGVVAGAIVRVEQNPDWSKTTNASGVYSFSVYHGTYTLHASSSGFYDSVSASTLVNKSQTKTVNFTLSAIATGTISGIAWYNSDLVISQVVASTLTFGHDGAEHDIEYVELYNPTTFPINIGQTADTLKGRMIAYYDENWTNIKYDWPAGWGNSFDMVQVTTYVAPGRYYLIANTTYFFASGRWLNADAYYDSGMAFPDYILDDKAGTVALYRWSDNTWADSVGWADNNDSAPWGEGVTIVNDPAGDGLGSPEGKQLVRVSSPAAAAAVHAAYGRAYDSNWNERDFLYDTNSYSSVSNFIAPRNHASGTFTTLTGKIPSGAYVSATDLNSGSTTTYTAYKTSGTLSLPYARFELPGVSTGTWDLFIAYNGYVGQVSTVAVTQNAVTSVPNATTSSSWTASGHYHVKLGSSSQGGFVRGQITNTNGVPISGIVVQGGGSAQTTISNGLYFMSIASGPITLVANPDNTSNSSYAQGIANVTIAQGAMTTQDFSLSLAGRLQGYVTTGTTPLSNQAVVALQGGSQVGSATTDGTGYFTMRNISTGTYTIQPALDSGQDANPNSFAATLNSTGTVFVGTFTISGAFGSISGTVSDASGLVTSGALLVASTNTISSTPPAIVGSSAPALTPYYMASSKADGSYELPVRGNATYYLSVYVPVISAAGSVSITTKTYSSILVQPSASTTRTVTIP